MFIPANSQNKDQYLANEARKNRISKRPDFLTLAMTNHWDKLRGITVNSSWLSVASGCLSEIFLSSRASHWVQWE